MKDRASSALASRLQEMMNDLKRDVATAARELALSPEAISAALGGDERAVLEMRVAAAAIWPISERDLAIVVDDTDAGVVLWPRAKAEESARIIERGGAPYYEYRDTAMSRLSPIRPEWIRMLAATHHLDPTDTDLKWNKGHALHQFTYFRGDVDFYFVKNGELCGDLMKEGDTAFIPSFTPHTFATTSDSRGGHIIAVTFPGRITGDAREELARSPRRLPDGGSGKISGFPERLDSMLSASSTSLSELASISRIDRDRLFALLEGRQAPTIDDRARLAAALEVMPADLSIDDAHPAEVVIRRSAEGNWSPFPDIDSTAYWVKRLAQSPVTPQGRPVEVRVDEQAGAQPRCDLQFALHQYGYVLEGAVRLQWLWEGVYQTAALYEGDSFYMKPGIPHNFSSTTAGSPGRVLSFRCAQAITLEVERELSQLGPAAAKYVGHQRAWY